jgi:hypothetical protein
MVAGDDIHDGSGHGGESHKCAASSDEPAPMPGQWVNARRDVRAVSRSAVRGIDGHLPPEAIDEWRGTTHPIVLDSTADELRLRPDQWRESPCFTHDRSFSP